MRGERCKDQMELMGDWTRGAVRKDHFLVRVEGLLPWPRIDAALGSLYSHTGRPSHPPRVLFKMMLLEQWYGLSDPECEAACRDRLSFRWFLGLGFGDAVPDQTALVRFGQRLASGSVMERLLGWVNDAFEEWGLILKQGTLIDATVIQSSRKAPPKDETRAADTSDPEAQWQAMKGKPVHGFKAHVAVDQHQTLIRAVVVTPANLHDATQTDALVQQDEAAVYADKAYDSRAQRTQLAALGIVCGILRRPARNHPLTAYEAARNRVLSRIRSEVDDFACGACAGHRGGGPREVHTISKPSCHTQWAITSTGRPNHIRWPIASMPVRFASSSGSTAVLNAARLMVASSASPRRRRRSRPGAWPFGDSPTVAHIRISTPTQASTMNGCAE